MTTFSLRRVGVLSAGILTGLCAASVVFVILSVVTVCFLLAGAVGMTDGPAIGELVPGIFGWGAIGIVVIPLVYGTIGFILGCLYALAYNLISRFTGGLEVDLELKIAPADAQLPLDPQ